MKLLAHAHLARYHLISRPHKCLSGTSHDMYLVMRSIAHPPMIWQSKVQFRYFFDNKIPEICDIYTIPGRKENPASCDADVEVSRARWHGVKLRVRDMPCKSHEPFMHEDCVVTKTMRGMMSRTKCFSNPRRLYVPRRRIEVGNLTGEIEHCGVGVGAIEKRSSHRRWNE